MEPLLELKEVTKIFQGRGRNALTAVDGVSFRLFPGETLGLVGESGSGKSTMGKAIARLLEVTSGQILLNGREITHLKGRALREAYGALQMVFQFPGGSFNPRRTLGDGIGESLRNQGLSPRETRARVEALLAQCGLSADYARRYPGEVSGGQCQRAAIARALAIGPRLLICDEATSALDVTIQAQILTLLKELQQEYGMSYLFICHNLALVQQFCDRVLVMHEGKIVEEGAPDEVILRPKCDYTRQLVNAVL